MIEALDEQLIELQPSVQSLLLIRLYELWRQTKLKLRELRTGWRTDRLLGSPFGRFLGHDRQRIDLLNENMFSRKQQSDCRATALAR